MPPFPLARVSYLSARRAEVDFEIDFMQSYDEASIIAELRRIASELGKKRITAQDIDKHGRVHSATVARKFGLLRHALSAAGLEPGKFARPSDEELIGEMGKLWVTTRREWGRSPIARDIARYGLPFSAKAITQRFGSWNKGLAAIARAMNESGGVVIPATRPGRKRMELSVARRFDVFKRDGYTCRICQKAGGELEVDHIVPVSKGGSNAMDNLQTVCWACNRGKAAKPM
jgi:hypothetical protein